MWWGCFARNGLTVILATWWHGVVASLTTAPCEEPLIKTYNKPCFGPGVEAGSLMALVTHTLSCLCHPRGMLAKLLARIRKSFCLKIDLQEKMYYKCVQVRRAVSPRRIWQGPWSWYITPREKWIYAHNKWPSSEESIPNTPSRAPRRHLLLMVKMMMSPRSDSLGR
jgi:hypothetical protein